MKTTKIFLGKLNESFSDKNSSLGSSYLRFILADILNNQKFFFNNTDLNKDISVITTISFCDISENKINDNFEFENISKTGSFLNKNKSKTTINNIKIFEYEDDIVIEGIKEIQITTIDQFDKLIQ